MKANFLSLMVPVLMAPAIASAQSAAGSVGAQAQAQAQTQSQVRTPQARIDGAMQAAARARVPVSLLESKVAEGAAKRVPQERVAAAVEARLSALVRAGETMDRAQVSSATAGDFAVTADALEAGVSENALIKVQRNAAPERRAVAVAVLADLVRLGHGSAHALTQVSAAIGSNAALARLNADVASQLHAGGLTSTLHANGLLRVK